LDGVFSRLAKTLADTVPLSREDEVSNILLKICSGAGQFLPHIAALMPIEFDRRSAFPETILRANSTVAKLSSQCAKVQGGSFLVEFLGPLIQAIASDTKQSFELDPQRMNSAGARSAEDMLPLHEAKLMQAALSLLDRITTDVDALPHTVRAIAALIRTAAEFRGLDPWPLVGGFIILRFINPAIVSPHAFGILPRAPEPIAQRNLVLVSKVLQNAANGVPFGDKEPYMQSMNSFLQVAAPQVKEYLQAAAAFDPAPLCVLRPVPVALASVGVRPICFLHELVSRTPAFVAALRLLAESGPDPHERQRAAQLATLVDALGPPPRRGEVCAVLSW
jgi:hypothetical protein